MKKLIYNKLKKEALNDLPKVTYPGKIVVVVSKEETERCVDYLLTQDVLGFDTETRPAFSKGTHYKCSLLQVATHDCCFLFRLNHTGLTPDIIRLLETTSIKKVGLAWRNDILSLKELGTFEPAGFIDLQDIKTERLSNWERDVLKSSQKNYAAIDAWACVVIYDELVRLSETGDYQLEIVPEETKPSNHEEDIS